MLLSARILSNVASVNVFTYENVARFTEGDGPDLYFQLIDASLDRQCDPPGRRYMPAAGATLEVTVQNIDNTKTLVRFASQPYATDPSIWKLTLLPTDKVRGTADLRLKLTESPKVTNGVAKMALSVEPLLTSRTTY